MHYKLLNGCCGPSWIATPCPARGHRSGDRSRVRRLRPVESRCTCHRGRRLYRDKYRFDELRVMAEIPELAQGWRDLARRRVQTQKIEDWNARLGGEGTAPDRRGSSSRPR